MQGYALELLGGFTLKANLGEELPVPSRKGQVLLALLAVNAGNWLFREKAVGLLWGDRGDAHARGSLRQELTNLRKLFSNGIQPIEIDGERMRLDGAAIAIDVSRFELAAKSEDLSEVERAIALYRGPFLGNLSVKDPACAEWMEQERDRYQTLYLTSMERLLARRTLDGPLDAAIEVAEAIVAQDPLREDIHRQLMELYARQGRHAHALKQFQVCRAILAKELDVQPEPATIRLFEQIRDNRTAWQQVAKSRSAPKTSGEVPGAPPDNISRSEKERSTSSGSGGEAAQLYQMARSFFLRNIWGKRALLAARQLFSQAIEADRTYARAYAGLSNCDCYRLLLGDRSVSHLEIAANIQRALELDPNLPEALAAKGLSLYVAGDHIGAIPLLEKATSLGPDLFEASYFSARNYRALGQHDKAAINFERAAAINKNDYRALGLLADEYRALGRLGDSLAASRACLDRVTVEVASCPDDCHALSFGSVILAELGEWGRAEEWAARARAIGPDDPIMNYNLACAFAQLGRSDEALDCLRSTFEGKDINRQAFFEWMREDSALDTLRTHPNFTAFVDAIGIGLDIRKGLPRSTPTNRLAIAVLPFINIGADPEGELLGDGLTDDIITDLSRQTGLSVVARSTVARYRLETPPIQEVARTLSVRYVLEGSVRTNEGHISVNAKLVDGFNGACLWADRYERDDANALTSQHQISRAIVEALFTQLLPGERLRLSELSAKNPAAYRQYLAGRTYLLMAGGGIPGLRVARQAYLQASQLDTNYAQAFAGMAMADGLRLLRGDADVTIDTIFAESERAIGLDPKLPEALTAKGLALYLAGRNAEAEEVLAKAIRAGPSLFEAHFFAARNSWVLGKAEEAAKLIERASELLPDHYRPLGFAVGIYRRLGNEEKMRSALRRCIDRCNAEISIHPTNVDALAFGAAVHADVGDHEEARKWISRAESYDPLDAIANYNIAASLATLGEIDRCLERLKRIMDLPEAERRPHLDWLRQDNSFDPVRDHPTFIALLRDQSRSSSNSDLSPSIAVLPFETAPGENSQVYLADGIAEEIIAALSRMRSFLVVARSSTLRYRGQPRDTTKISEELGVRYLLEGSIRTSADRIRVSMQLIDATISKTIWAERFEKSREDIFDLQDEITERTVGAIEPNIRKAEIERARRKRPENLDAYDYVMRATPLMLEMTERSSAEALRLTSTAARLDPGYARAHAMAAWCHAWLNVNDWSNDREQSRQEGMRMAQAAIRLDGEDPLVLTMVSAAEMLLVGDIESAAAHISKALALDPNSAWAWIRSGYVQIYLGNSETALQHFERAARLSPFDPLNFNLYVGRSMAHFAAGRYREASEWAGMALAERPGLPGGYKSFIASMAKQGRLDQARAALKEFLQVCPSASIATVLETTPFGTGEFRNRLIEGLREAGLPETSQASVRVSA